MKQYVMALDQGTTSSRCILFDKQGEIISMAQREFAQIYPKPGWVEQDPREIWASQFSVAMEAMSLIGITAEQVAAIGITNQRETTIVWNKNTGEPVYHAIVWQCRRTADRIQTLLDDGMGDYVTEHTGLVPDAYFSASKVAWILDHVPGARALAEKGELLFGTVDTWLIWNLTKGKVHVTDYTNASRTMLYDIHHLCWDEKILDYFQIPKQMLPDVKPSSCCYGKTSATLFGAEVPISGAAGDQQAALFGQGCFQKGEGKNTYGTGSFILMNTGEKAVRSSHGLLTTMAAGVKDQIQYALEGSVFVAGAAVQWLRDEMQLFEQAKMSEKLAKSVESSGGVYVVPAFTGLGAPYWNPYVRGSVFGITRGTSKAHFVRATLESIAYQTNDVIHAMEQDLGAGLSELKVDGGASANDFLMQFQADITNTVVKRPKCIETTALGAAYLAGLAVGYWESLEDIQKNWSVGATFTPEFKEQERKEKLRQWKKAVDCALLFAKD